MENVVELLVIRGGQRDAVAMNECSCTKKNSNDQLYGFKVLNKSSILWLES